MITKVLLAKVLLAIVFGATLLTNTGLLVQNYRKEELLNGVCTDEVISSGIGGKCSHKTHQLEERAHNFVCRCPR